MAENLNNIDFNSITPLDYDMLKECGLKYIQSIANKNWTDFNLHDPGVTILEALCFGLTDLAYRTEFEMKDLLTKQGHLHPNLAGTLYPAESILPSNPLSILDYRKFIFEKYYNHITDIQIESNDYSIKDPHNNSNSTNIKGFYDVRIQLKSDADKSIANQILLDLNRHRNIGEVFKNIRILKPLDFGICLKLETNPYADISSIIEKIYQNLEKFVSPTLPRYNISQLVARGKSFDEIFQGIIPDSKLFVDRDELEPFVPKKELKISDFVNIIMSIDGVENITHLQFICNESDVVSMSNSTISLESEEYYFHLTPFTVSSSQSSIANENRISIIRNNFEIPIQLTNREEISNSNPIADATDFPRLESKNRNIHKYHSIQNIFPKCYALGKEGISKYASDLRKDQRLQLKGYLTFFDQLLADYLAQLDNIENFFSINEDEDKYHSYFYSQLTDEEITDVSKVLDYKNIDYQTVSHPNSTENLKRIKIIDHLLARFNDSFANYALFAYIQSNQLNLEYEIEKKKEILREYPTVSSNRTLGTNLSTNNWTICGAEKRILAKLGIIHPKEQLTPAFSIGTIQQNSFDKSNDETPKFSLKHSISFFNNSCDGYENSFGLHIIDHILFVPKVKDHNLLLRLTENPDSANVIENPYSFHTTVLLPGWLSYCKKKSFRDLVEKTIREEMPAHIVSKICWVNPFVMFQIESLLKIISPNKSEESLKYYLDNEITIKHFCDIFNNIESIYSTNSEEIEINSKKYHSNCDYCLDNFKLNSTSLETCSFNYDAQLWSYDFPLKIEHPDFPINENPGSSHNSSSFFI